MNKAELVQALAERLDGDRKVATDAVDGLLDVIVRTVHAGDSVSVTGFGVFEPRDRAARSARNPRTGQLIDIPATTVPVFRAGAMFRDVVSGARPLGDAPARSAPARPTATTATRQAPKPSVNAAPVPTADAVAVATEHTPVDGAEVSVPKAATRSKAKPAKAEKAPAKVEKAPAKTEKATKDAKAEKPAKEAKADKATKDAKVDAKAKNGKKKAKK